MQVILFGLFGLIFFSAAGRDGNGMLGLLVGVLMAMLLKANKRLSTLERTVSQGAVSSALQNQEAVASSAPKVEKVQAPEAAQQKPEQAKPEVPKAAPPLSPEIPAAKVTPAQPPPAPKPAPLKASAPPPSNDFVAQLLEPIGQLFSTKNLIAKLGILFVFVGVGFLLKYVSDHNLLSIELRLCGCALGGLILLGFGWRLRKSRATFGLILQGGGIGVVYLTVFAAYRIYHLLPGGFTFGLLFVLAVLTAMLSVIQDSLALATLGSTGGFLAPILASTGSGNYIALFSYYAVLNVSLLLMAWKKSWRELYMLGFWFTFFVSASWGSKYYRPEYFNSVEPFLIFYFLIYFLVPVFAVMRSLGRLHALESVLVVALPLTVFPLQANLVKDMHLGIAISAALMGALYIFTAHALWRKYGKALLYFVQIFLAIGLAAITLAVPYAFSNVVTSSIWALEGLALIWVGLKQDKVLLRFAGYALQFCAGCAFLVDAYHLYREMAFLNPIFVGCSLLAISHLLCAFYLRNESSFTPRAWERKVGILYFFVGLVWWVCGGLSEIDDLTPNLSLALFGSDIYSSYSYDGFENRLQLLFFTSTLAVLALLSRPLKWSFARVPFYIYFPTGALFFVSQLNSTPHPFEQLGWLTWGAFFLLGYLVLRKQECSTPPTSFWLDHLLGLWTITVLLGHELGFRAYEVIGLEDAWVQASLPLVVCFVVLLVLALPSIWPFSSDRKLYVGLGMIPLIVYLAIFTVFIHPGYEGYALNIPYVPILNPLDLVQLMAMIVCLRWQLACEGLKWELTLKRSTAIGGLAFLAFVWSSTVIMRVMHIPAAVPWRASDLMANTSIQAALTIYWSLAALIVMVLANRKAWRVLWLCGAVLLGLVTMKLLFVDLSSRGTLSRIFSFLGSGVLLLLIGYLAPIPPETQEEKKK